MNTSGRKIDFVGNCIPESTAYFFIKTLKLIFTHFIEIRIFEKQFLALKNFVLEGCFLIFLP